MRSPSPAAGGRKRGVLIWWGSWSASGSVAGSGSGSAFSAAAWSARSFYRTVQSAPAVTVWPIPLKEEVLGPAASASEASAPQRSRKLRRRRKIRKRRTARAGESTQVVGTGPEVLGSICSSSAGLTVESRPARSVGPTGGCSERGIRSRGKKPIFVVCSLVNRHKCEFGTNSTLFRHLPSYAQVIASSPTVVVRRRLSRLLSRLRPLIR